MSRFRCFVASIAALPVIVGCVPQPVNQAAVDTATLGELVTALASAEQLDPGAPTEPVRIQIFNSEPVDGAVRLTMRLDGAIISVLPVDIAAGATTTITGPAEVDSILVEATLESIPAETLPLRTLFVGHDFAAGELVRITLSSSVDVSVPGADAISDVDTRDAAPGVPLNVAIDGLPQDVNVLAGTPVSFDVVTHGASALAMVRVMADPDTEAGNGNEWEVYPYAYLSPQARIRWNTGNVVPGAYSLYAEVLDRGEWRRSAYALGRILINIPAALVFDSPIDGLTLNIGQTFNIGWAGQSSDAAATILVFIDSDGAYNGNEVVLRSGILAADASDRTYVADTTGWATGTYRIGGVIADSLSSVVVYGPSVNLLTPPPPPPPSGPPTPPAIPPMIPPAPPTSGPASMGPSIFGVPIP